jgi:hypothetical protein
MPSGIAPAANHGAPLPGRSWRCRLGR